MRKLVSVVALACSLALIPLSASAAPNANAGVNPCVGQIVSSQGYTPAEAPSVYPEFFGSVQEYMKLQQNCRIFPG